MLGRVLGLVEGLVEGRVLGLVDGRVLGLVSGLLFSGRYSGRVESGLRDGRSTPGLIISGLAIPGRLVLSLIGAFSLLVGRRVSARSAGLEVDRGFKFS